jgi:hypothetical protein
MKKFVFVYYGNEKAEKMTEDQRKSVMEEWGKWFESMKDSIVDGGNPFANGAQVVTASGIDSIPESKMPSKGYTIINARTMEEATEIAKGSPSLKDNSDGAVRVYEAMPM